MLISALFICGMILDAVSDNDEDEPASVLVISTTFILACIGFAAYFLVKRHCVGCGKRNEF